MAYFIAALLKALLIICWILALRMAMASLQREWVQPVSLFMTCLTAWGLVCTFEVHAAVKALAAVAFSALFFVAQWFLTQPAEAGAAVK